MSGRIGVVVVSHESAEDLPTCLAALTAASGVERVVVVDNASSDASKEVVGAVKDERVLLVAETSNTGFAGGCNRGFRALAEHLDVLAFLNPDVVVEPDCLVRCADALAAAQAYGVTETENGWQLEIHHRRNTRVVEIACTSASSW